MPIYEFFCAGCRDKVEVFRRSIATEAPLRCPRCGGEELRRLISRVNVHRSGAVYGSADEERYLQGLDDEDPRAMAAWARQMARESGEGMDPEFEQLVSQMEAGAMPDEDGYGDDGDFDGLDA